MTYHDSIKQADEKMKLSIKQLHQWNLPALPINYAVGYEYIIGKNAPLLAAIKQQLASGKALDNFFIDEIYRQFILGQSKFRDDIIDDVDDVLTFAHKNAQHSSKSTKQFLNAIDTNIKHINSSDQEKINASLTKIRHASEKFKKQQFQLQSQLQASQSHTQTLKIELEEMRKEIYLDPLTNLYNRKAMSQHLDAWLGEDPEKKVAAIVINIEHFSQFNQKFGPLISDILLSKVANKVSSYVDDSGLPVRTGGDEFIILLPDVEKNVADEIALKIRHGIQKLRFVSSKSGVRLPQLSVITGTNEFRVTESVKTIIQKSRQMITGLAKETAMAN